MDLFGWVGQFGWVVALFLLVVLHKAILRYFFGSVVSKGKKIKKKQRKKPYVLLTTGLQPCTNRSFSLDEK